MSVTIRQAAGSDTPYFFDICLKTGYSGKNAEHLFSDPLMIGQYYAAPYLFFQNQYCFTAELDAVPQGYIIGTSDSIAFYNWFETEWLPVIRKRYTADYPASSPFEKHIVNLIQAPATPPKADWLQNYPAHLHIDLLPTLQGKGCGRALMDAFTSALAHNGVRGVHLGVSADNTSAVGFYKKMGFSVLVEESWGYTMGLSCR